MHHSAMSHDPRRASKTDARTHPAEGQASEEHEINARGSNARTQAKTRPNATLAFLANPATEYLKMVGKTLAIDPSQHDNVIRLSRNAYAVGLAEVRSDKPYLERSQERTEKTA